MRNYKFPAEPKVIWRGNHKRCTMQRALWIWILANKGALNFFADAYADVIVETIKN